MKNKILIFGINGFTGKHFQKYIIENNLALTHEFIGVDVKEYKNIGFKTIKVNVLDSENLLKVLSNYKPDYILNFAGKLWGSYNEMYEINAGFTQMLCEKLIEIKHSPKKILLVGSAAEYGTPKVLPITEDHQLKPLNYYGLSKKMQTIFADYYTKNSNLNIVIARTFNVLGENMNPYQSIPAFINRVKETINNQINVGNLMTKRDYLWIDDVIDAYWKILIKGKNGEAYNVCSGVSIKMKEFLNEIVKCSGKKISLNIDKQFIRKNDILDIYGNHQKLDDLDWMPVHNVIVKIQELMKGSYE